MSNKIFKISFLFLTLLLSTKNYCQSQNENIELTFVVDSAAHFPGGKQAYNLFILQNIRYPIEAQKSNIQGKLYVTFIVLSTGKIANIVTSEGANKLLAAEVKRLIQIMPDWIPAYYQGKAVNSQTSLPISFSNLGVINR